MESILIIPVIFGFFMTLFFLSPWINRAKRIGLVWEDMNKYSSPKNTAGSGGIIVLLGFVVGVLLYIGVKTFILQTNVTTVQIFALTTTILIAGFIGMIDDFLGWAQGGLSARFRIFLMIIACIPLMAINAGESRMMGIEFGLIYPLVLIPLGIIGSSTTFNFLAGYNGLEASQGILILSGLSIVALFTGSSWLSLILMIMIACLAAFYIFNKYPSKIFPGDSLTYSVGALIAITAILGNIEKMALFFFIPYIMETGLKVRGKLKKQSFSKVNPDNSLEIPYNKFYGIEHIAIWVLKKIKKDKKVYEKEVVYLINLFQVLVIITGLILFRGQIF